MNSGWIKAMILSSVVCGVCSRDLIYSNDTFTFKLSHNVRSISGPAGSRHELEFILKNHGSSGSFVIRQEKGVISGQLDFYTVYLKSDEMVSLGVKDLVLPSARGEFIIYQIEARREDSQYSRRTEHNRYNDDGGRYNSESRPDHNGGYNGGDFNSGSRPDHNGGYNGGDFNSGSRPDHNGGYNGGDYNSGSRPDHNGGYNGGSEYQTSGGSSRPDILTPGFRSSVKSSVIFHVHNRHIPTDRSLPVIHTKSVKNVCPSDLSCSQYSWPVFFSIRDAESGLFMVNMIDNNGMTPFWWKDNHAVGEKEEVTVGAEVSCCSHGISLEVEDFQRNKLIAYEEIGDHSKFENWNLVIGISVGVGLMVLIILIGLGVYRYKKRSYSSVSQDP